MSEKLSEQELFPTKFEPKRAYRWILAVDGVDAFIVKSLVLPKWTAEAGEAKILTPLVIEFWDPISPNGAQQVMAACKKSSVAPLNIRVKLLDAVGIVVSTWDLPGAVVDEVDFGNLDYANGENLVIRAKFKVKDMLLDKFGTDL